jgi:CheY-like chemotaxis protein
MSADGVGVMERLSEIYPGHSIPVIGLAHDPGADPESLARLGVDRFVTKPFSLSVLRSLARELLEAYRSG